MRKLLVVLFALALPSLALAQGFYNPVPRMESIPGQWGTYKNAGANTVSTFVSSGLDTAFFDVSTADTTGVFDLHNVSWIGAGGTASSTINRVGALVLYPTLIGGAADTVYASVEESPDGVNFYRNPGNALTYQTFATLNDVTDPVIVIPLSWDIDALNGAAGTEGAAPFVRFQLRTGAAMKLAGVKAKLFFYEVTNNGFPVRVPSFTPIRVNWSVAGVDSITRLIGAGVAQKADTTVAISTAGWARGAWRVSTTNGIAIKFWVAGSISTADSLTIDTQISNNGTTWVSLSSAIPATITSTANKASPVQSGQTFAALTAGSGATENFLFFPAFVRFIVTSTSAEYIAGASFYYATFRQP